MLYQPKTAILAQGPKAQRADIGRYWSRVETACDTHLAIYYSVYHIFEIYTQNKLHVFIEFALVHSLTLTS